jgi:CRP-like cAMP-binding protein
MKSQDRARLLATLGEAPLLRGLSASSLEDVAAQAKEKRAEAGATLFREGEPASVFYLVLKGRVKLTQVGANGHEVILRFVGPGEAVAALALFEGATYPLTASAVSESLLLVWRRDVLRELFQHHPPLAVNAMRLLSERLREVQARFRELATERVAQRIARALVRQTGRRVEDGVLIDLPLSRQDLADMTGTTLYTVSRVLSEWESRGILESGREKVLVKQPHALVAIAEDLPHSAVLRCKLIDGAAASRPGSCRGGCARGSQAAHPHGLRPEERQETRTRFWSSRRPQTCLEAHVECVHYVERNHSDAAAGAQHSDAPAAAAQHHTQ